MDMTALPHRRLRATAFPAALVALGLALAGCEGVKDQLGLTKQSPDEFSIVTRAPLTLPPNFSLRPPAPGERRPQEATAQERAKAAIYGAAAEAPAGDASAGEQALLSRAGAGESAPDIRRIINEENAIYAAGNQTFVDRLIFWQEPAPLGTVVDPAMESQRLQEADALGEPPTGGETPVIKRREKGIFEGIF